MRKTQLGCTILEGHDVADLPLVSENAEILEKELLKKATQEQDGRMSKEDKTKLDGIEAGANKYVHPKTHSADIIIPNADRRFVSDTEKEAWNAKETPEGAQAKVDAVQANLDEHKAEKATQDKAGHIKLSDIPVKSVNSQTGEVVIDVGDIAGLVSSRLALGWNASAGGDSAVALGYNTSAAGAASVALGRNASAGDSAVALGYNTSAAGAASVALGRGASAENAYEGILGKAGSYATSKWIVPGSFTVSGTKNFEIPHPKPEKSATHVIRHGAVESPTPGDTLYRWKVQATKDNDIITIDLPDYFIHLNKNVQVFVTPQGHFGNGYGTLNRETEQLEIHCQYEGEYNVLVIGTRNDDHQSVQDWDIKGVEREIGESWTGETYVFSVDEIMEVEEIKEVI